MTPRGGVMAGARGRVVLRRQLRRRSGHGGRAGHANLAGVVWSNCSLLLPSIFCMLHQIHRSHQAAAQFNPSRARTEKQQ